MSETVGSRIKKARKESKLKQVELAEKIDIHFSMISLYESDKRVPSFEVAERIARVTNTSVDYIMGLSKHKTLNKEKSDEVSKEVADLMERINKLSPEKRKVIEDLINNF